MRNEIKRYHKSIYLPENFNSDVEVFFSEILKGGPITFSLHSIEKLIEAKEEYGKILWKGLQKIIKNISTERGLIFEAYYKNGKILKVCLRHEVEDSPVDLILVVSDSGTVITMYTTFKKDNHATMRKNLYEKRKETPSGRIAIKDKAKS